MQLSFFNNDPKKGNKTHLQDLVSLLHPLLVRRAVWLNSTYKDPNIIASHESKTQTLLFNKPHCVHIRAVPEENKGDAEESDDRTK